MPELPEVETIRRSLTEKIQGKTVNDVGVLLDKMIKGSEPEEIKDLLRGKKILKIDRRGKYLIIHLTGGLAMVVHLRMTGKLVCCDCQDEIVKHTHVVFHLSDEKQLRFIDQRQFGKVQIVSEKEIENISGLKTLGIEPFSEEFTRDYLRKIIRSKRTKIKPLLLDQTFVAGIGNIYADEALFRARIHPERVAATLSPREVSQLYIAIKEVLSEGIENNGTSIKDYVDAAGQKGENQNNLRVYGREGEKCVKCGTLIERKSIGGRSSHFCSKCQK